MIFRAFWHLLFNGQERKKQNGSGQNISGKIDFDKPIAWRPALYVNVIDTDTTPDSESV